MWFCARLTSSAHDRLLAELRSWTVDKVDALESMVDELRLMAKRLDEWTCAIVIFFGKNRVEKRCPLRDETETATNELIEGWKIGCYDPHDIMQPTDEETTPEMWKQLQGLLWFFRPARQRCHATALQRIGHDCRTHLCSNPQRSNPQPHALVFFPQLILVMVTTRTAHRSLKFTCQLDWI